MTSARLSTQPAQELHPAHPDFPPIWRQLNSKWCRDLAWALCSPDMLQHPLGEFQRFNFYPRMSGGSLLSWLQQLDKTAPPLTRPVARLGLYFEQLLSYAFTCPQFAQMATLKLLLKNMQIVENRKTIGELDFILERPDKGLLHLEVAVKFYLLKRGENGGDWMHWIGPNPRDRLDIKLGRLQYHQLPLGHQSQTARHCLARRLPDWAHQCTIESSFYLKGMLFVHWQDKIQRPAWTTEHALLGHWLTWSEYLSLQASTTLQFKPLHKLDWLTASMPQPLHTTPPSPFMALWVNHSKKEQTNLLDNRVMVVPDYWPDTSSPSRRM